MTVRARPWARAQLACGRANGQLSVFWIIDPQSASLPRTLTTQTTVWGLELSDDQSMVLLVLGSLLIIFLAGSAIRGMYDVAEPAPVTSSKKPKQAQTEDPSEPAPAPAPAAKASRAAKAALAEKAAPVPEPEKKRAPRSAKARSKSPAPRAARAKKK